MPPRGSSCERGAGCWGSRLEGRGHMSEWPGLCNRGCRSADRRPRGGRRAKKVQPRSPLPLSGSMRPQKKTPAMNSREQLDHYRRNKNGGEAFLHVRLQRLPRFLENLACLGKFGQELIG